MLEAIKRLTPESLISNCDPQNLGFARTDEVTDGDPMVGQARAREALQFGLGLRGTGYNVFVLGSIETAANRVVQQLLETRAESDSVPSDWCYVFNFDIPDRPNLICLPPGRGTELQSDMKRFTAEAQTSLAAAFESEEYQTRTQGIREEFQREHDQALQELEKNARAKGIVLVRAPSGFAFMPLKGDEAMALDEIRKIGDEDRRRFESAIEELHKELLHILRQVPGRQRRMRQRIRELDEEIARYAVHDLLEELRSKYSGLEEMEKYLGDVERDVVSNLWGVLRPDSAMGETAPYPLLRSAERSLLVRYEVNPLVSNEKVAGAPVVVEDHPTMQNLIGRVEYRSEMGALVTDFTLIKRGSLHIANGGYLLIDARKLLTQPFAWEALKRALRTCEVAIKSVHEELGLSYSVTLDPEPMPLDVKVVVCGEPWLYDLLCQVDPEFAELFRIEADFDDRMDRTAETEQKFGRLVAYLARSNDLKPMDRNAVGRVVEFAARRAEDALKLSIESRAIQDLIREADYLAAKGKSELITREHVEQALEARRRRRGRIRERVQEAILRDTLMIATTGTAVGQINGLSVVAIGMDTFARPTRITARAQIGRGNVLDVEREVELGGPIHSKGVMILSSFLGARFATDVPLSLSASLVFEQSYGEIEGDSASVAELCALLSAVAEVPLRQSLSVTGSVNQHGVIQAIGGVNEKIEGFFDICQARGLAGDQGVIIPAANVKHLMLRSDVVDAVREGKFNVYAVTTIDEAMSLLTGEVMGERAEDGTFAEGTINARIFERLSRWAEERMAFLLVSSDNQAT